MRPRKQSLCKRPYRKPKVRTIELAAKEVLGLGCKTNTGGFNSGPANTPCSAYATCAGWDSS